VGKGREVVATGGSRGACVDDRREVDPSMEVRAFAASTSCVVVLLG